LVAHRVEVVAAARILVEHHIVADTAAEEAAVRRMLLVVVEDSTGRPGEGRHMAGEAGHRRVGLQETRTAGEAALAARNLEEEVADSIGPVAAAGHHTVGEAVVDSSPLVAVVVALVGLLLLVSGAYS
jgi:hypothetical protein